MGQSDGIIEKTYGLVFIEDRDARMQSAVQLARLINDKLVSHNFGPIVGEAGQPEWVEATIHLIGRKKLNPVEAWMVAETVATGAAAAHALDKMEEVTDEQIGRLTEHLALGALRLTGTIYRVN